MSNKEKRYFIVYFSGLDDENELRRGKMYVVNEDGRYVNEEFVFNTVINEFNLQSPYISNIQELSESDFADFVAVSDEQQIEDDENITKKENSTNKDDFL